MSLSLVVMAAGVSTRFGRLRQLHPIGPGGEAILDYNVYDAAQAGFDRILFVVRPEILEDVRAHVDRIVGKSLPIEYVCQELGQVPAGFRVPPDRKKPWGTGQAVIQAAAHIEGPFGVCNAGDLYGTTAFEMLANHLRSPTDRSALIGYRLADTMFGSGAVARGICVLRPRGLLERITEVRNIRQNDGWVTGTRMDGEPVELTGNEIVSMNLWGFLPSVVPLMQRQFIRFLEHWGSDTDQEFFLSTAVSGLVQLGVTSMQVLRAPDPWFGIRYVQDLERTREELHQRISAGLYPDRLADAFPQLV